MFKVFAFRLTFFKSKMEVIDALIVLTSWGLDIAFFHHTEQSLISLVIFLRLWRIVRVVHGIALSMITPLEHKLEKEKEHVESKCKQLEVELKYSSDLEHEIQMLRDLLTRQSVDCKLPETCVRLRDVSAR